MPKSVTDYNLGGSFPNFNEPGYKAYVQEAAKIADPTLDFALADVVILAHSPTVKSTQIGTFIAEAGMPGSGFSVKSAEKTILNVMIQGGDQVRDIQNWIHEFGHMLGVTDNGGQSGGSGLGFDVMQWYGNPELTIWNRFVLGAALDSQISCVSTDSSSTHWIRPVASTDANTKGVVIPLTKDKAIVVESRRRLGFDALLGKNSEGALVYVVDTTKSGSDGSAPFKVVGPARMTILGMWSIDAPLKKGESVFTNGWTISVIESGAFGDVVKVQKG
jgi:hypothetical protein